MLSFSPDIKLEKELKALQGKIVEAHHDLQSASAEEKQYLHRWAFISNIGASTRIENAVLTDQEIEWVDTTLTQDGKTTAFEEKRLMIVDKLRDKLSKDKERSIEEVVGCREMLTTIYGQHKELFPLTESTLRGLHHQLLRFFPKASSYAGGYKTSPNRVVSVNHDTGEERVVLDPASPGTITATEMSNLVDWYNKVLYEHPWPLLVASEFVFRFLAIHPFQDGNGRLGRGLFLLALLQSDDSYLSGVAPYIAFDRHIEQNRPHYYMALHQCSDGKFYTDATKYNYEPIVWFFLKVMEGSIEDVAIYRKRYATLQKLPESALIILQCFKTQPEARLKVSDIEKETTDLSRRTIQRMLKTLTEEGFLQHRGQGASSRYQLVF